MKTKSSVAPAASEYFMESEEEAVRLDIKTNPDAVRRQAVWCGVTPGMRVLDAGCGAGVTTSVLNDMVRPGGSVLGVDYSPERVKYALQHYGDQPGIEFALHDLRESAERFGKFDLIWVRFVLEYHRIGATTIVRNMIDCLNPGGALCLLDLDYNCLSHYELPATTMSLLHQIMDRVDEQFNFDTFIGRKLYSFLYDAGLSNIRVELMAHNLFYGAMKESDKFNLMKKIEIAGKTMRDLIDSCYRGGYERFREDFHHYLEDPRRFTYTPLLICRGEKSLSD